MKPTPPWSLLQQGTARYVPSHKTNLHKTFARIRREQKAAAEARATEHVVLALPGPKTTRKGGS